MVSKKTAVKPDFFAKFSSFKRDEEAKEKSVTDDERAYYSMYLTSGWKLFNSDIEQLLSEMDQLNDSAVANGLSLEEIGRNTVVFSLARGILKRLLNKIEDAKEACERPGGQ